MKKRIMFLGLAVAFGFGMTVMVSCSEASHDEDGMEEVDAEGDTH